MDTYGHSWEDGTPGTGNGIGEGNPVRQIVRETVCDLTGQPGAEPVRFSIDGMEYEIDLIAAVSMQLREALSPFMRSGRRIAPRRAHRRVIVKREAGAGIERAAREWARDHYDGPPFSSHGRVPGAVIRAYENAIRG